MSAATTTKRASSSSASSPPTKRARNENRGSESPEPEDHDDNHEHVDPANMNDEEKAKAARREARTIRNRESAQRSRNQRKAHLAWLESRVVELEAENRALRSGSAPSTPSHHHNNKSASRESSPANSVLSLANDLGIPPEIVSAGGGVNLAAVAPPSADVLEDIKPAIPTEPVAVATPPQLPAMSSAIPASAEHANDLHVENAALRWRVSMLENIVKQAATFFSAYNAVDGQAPPAAVVINNANTGSRTPVSYQPSSAMEATLSPPLYPTAVSSAAHNSVSSPLNLQTSLPTTNPATSSGDAVSSLFDLSNPLARHPAVVATLPAVSQSISGRRAEAVGRGEGGRSVGEAAGMDFSSSSAGNPFASFEAAAGDGGNAGSAQVVGGPSPDGWFREGSQAAQWDEGMNELLETLEGGAAHAQHQPEGVASIGGDSMGMTMESSEWAWEQALVDI